MFLKLGKHILHNLLKLLKNNKMITKTKIIELSKKYLCEVESLFPKINGQIVSIDSQSHIYPNNEEHNWSNIQIIIKFLSYLKSEVNLIFDLQSKDDNKKVSIYCTYIKLNGHKKMSIDPKWNYSHNFKTSNEQLIEIKNNLIKRQV